MISGPTVVAISPEQWTDPALPDGPPGRANSSTCIVQCSQSPSFVVFSPAVDAQGPGDLTDD